MKCLLLLVFLSISAQASFAGKWQGLKQMVTPLSKKVAGGIAVMAVGTTLAIAPLSNVDAHHPNKYTELFEKAADKTDIQLGLKNAILEAVEGYGHDNVSKDFAKAAREAAEKTDVALGVSDAMNALETYNIGNQFYNDLQTLRRVANLELLGTFGVFRVELLAGNVERIIDRYELSLQLRRQDSRAADFLNASLGLSVNLQYNMVAGASKTRTYPSAVMIPSSLEKLYLEAKADLGQLTEQYVLQVIGMEDYLTNKDKILVQVKKDIDAQKRQRIRSMTRTSRFGGYRK